jgi:hypothetical protein
LHQSGNDGERTTVVQSRQRATLNDESGLSVEAFVAAASSLRPAFDTEWKRMKQDARTNQSAADRRSAATQPTDVGPPTTYRMPPPVRGSPEPWPVGVSEAQTDASESNYGKRVTLLPPGADGWWLTAWPGVVDGIVCYGQPDGVRCIPMHPRQKRRRQSCKGRAATALRCSASPLGTRSMSAGRSSGPVEISFVDFGKSAYGSVLLGGTDAIDVLVFSLPNGRRMSVRVEVNSFGAKPANAQAFAPPIG